MANSAKKASRGQYILWLGIPGLLAALIFLGSMGRIISIPGLLDADHPPNFPRAGLAIQRTDGQQIPFSIEVATTPQQSEYGLMFRKSLPADTGMLFLFVPDQPVSMWMANTIIPLDMLFVRSDGTITKIVTHTTPYSRQPISSDEPVKGVIEINDGQAAKQGIKVGDKVLYPGFGGQR